MIARRGVLLGALALPVIARAQGFAGAYAPAAIAIGEGIWLVPGADEALEPSNGGAIANSVIMASDAGAIVVDSGPSLGFGKALAALAEQLTGKAPARVYITHLHPDHSFGSAAFARAEIHSLPATRTDLERDGAGFSDAMYRLLQGWMAGTELILPQPAAADGVVTFGGRRLRLMALSGHSAGDLAILDEASGTLIAGDLVFHNRAPTTPHADLPAWHAALARLAATPHRQCVPGHGPLDRGSTAIAQTGDWLRWLEDSLREAVGSGLDMAEAANLPIPARFADMAMARYELTRSVSHLYPRFEAELLPRIDG
ncbi:quinoprotein relay system zinc metallohydrolase 1 [Erythrobacter tepidarius]|uniref:quinoprotein relay system zinc metallohydrolase 1 n=1 Tax=Erythrobacter tepidarius TaxID=60454 RepID=UPI000A395BB4|nr:quinoprotein relay system zinc metallohydrolase 1 [Erythrobacter tepidarius]